MKLALALLLCTLLATGAPPSSRAAPQPSVQLAPTAWLLGGPVWAAGAALDASQLFPLCPTQPSSRPSSCRGVQLAAQPAPGRHRGNIDGGRPRQRHRAGLGEQTAASTWASRRRRRASLAGLPNKRLPATPPSHAGVCRRRQRHRRGWWQCWRRRLRPLLPGLAAGRQRRRRRRHRRHRGNGHHGYHRRRHRHHRARD